MLRLPSTILPGLFLWFVLLGLAPFLAGQANPSVPPQSSPSPSSSAQSISAPSGPGPTDQTQAPDAEAIPPNAPHISQQARYNLIRDFETQLVYARTAFPMGKKGLLLKDGVITPNGEELRQELNLWGPAVKPGDPARISFVRIKSDHIHFEINGGPEHHKKWYQRVEISGTGGTPVTGGANEPQMNPHGSFVDVYFDKYVPEMTAEQLRALLYPVLDFKAKSKEQAYLDTVPPKVKQAILAHHVLVGMNQEMVLHAKGKPPKKVRERDGTTDYEEWIYGEPPADVEFVRLVGDEVVRVETMKVGGEKIVRTEKEVILESSDSDKDKEAKKEPAGPSPNPPTLRRPGEDSADVPAPANRPSSAPPAAPPDIPQPPNGPNQVAATR
jgi:hypothetical protein